MKVHIVKVTATEGGQVVTLSNGDTLECLDSVETWTSPLHGPMGLNIKRTEFELTGIIS